MPIRVPITMLRFTREQYTGVMQMFDLDATPQEGMIFYCAGQASGGWRVLGIWICRARSSTSTRGVRGIYNDLAKCIQKRFEEP
jgi:hypothetical protein